LPVSTLFSYPQKRSAVLAEEGAFAEPIPVVL
jgi:hypothetical protein